MSRWWFNPEKAKEDLKEVSSEIQRIIELKKRREQQLVKREKVPKAREIPENASVEEILNIHLLDMGERSPELAKDWLYSRLDQRLCRANNISRNLGNDLKYHRIEQEAFSDVYSRRVDSAVC